MSHKAQNFRDYQLLKFLINLESQSLSIFLVFHEINFFPIQTQINMSCK